MNNYVLIAETDRGLAASHAEIFACEGLTPVLAPDGDAATAVLVQRGAPDLLLTELSLPHVDGFELIERLRRTEGGGATPVIVVSGSREQRDKAIEQRVSLGIGAILATAASHDSMRRIIKRLLEDRLAARPGAGEPPEAPSREDRAGEPQTVADLARDTGIRLRNTNIRMSAALARRKRIRA